ncbi:citrate-binding protein-like [Quillaja saponaria]|uniref:Citrate-binding protein-like n=1 Tax=Quillaja saponaria TaxID=32244 RepID=A0AAD7LFS2_QUISA|nr:citrate-binding protein-like [Quillaja saponaria]
MMYLRISFTVSLMEFTDVGFSPQTNLILPPAKPNLVPRLPYKAMVTHLGTWQFEGDWYVPKGTSGVCIMQVFGASPPHATTLMLRVYNGSLTYYKSPVLVEDIYDKWFRLNVIHDVDAAKVQVYINGSLKIEADGRGYISCLQVWCLCSK